MNPLSTGGWKLLTLFGQNRSAIADARHCCGMFPVSVVWLPFRGASDLSAVRCVVRRRVAPGRAVDPGRRRGSSPGTANRCRLAQGIRSSGSRRSNPAAGYAQEIRVTLTPEEQTLLAATRDVDAAAYDAVVKGRYLIHLFTPEDFQLASQHFENAIAIDPTYGPGHVGGFWAFAMEAGAVPPDVARPQAKAALEQALKLDATSAEAYMLKAGLTFWSDWDWEEGMAAFQRSLDLDPNYAEAGPDPARGRGVSAGCRDPEPEFRGVGLRGGDAPRSGGPGGDRAMGRDLRVAGADERHVRVRRIRPCPTSTPSRFPCTSP